MPTSSWAWVPDQTGAPRRHGPHAHDDVGMPPGMDRRMKRRGGAFGEESPFLTLNTPSPASSFHARRNP